MTLLADSDDLERQIRGGLASAIAAHGPITKDRIPSATKRIAGQILARQNELEAETVPAETVPAFPQAEFEHWVRLNTMSQCALWLAEDGEADAAERVVAFAHDQGWVTEEADE